MARFCIHLVLLHLSLLLFFLHPCTLFFPHWAITSSIMYCTINASICYIFCIIFPQVESSCEMSYAWTWVNSVERTIQSTSLIIPPPSLLWSLLKCICTKGGRLTAQSTPAAPQMTGKLHFKAVASVWYISSMSSGAESSWNEALTA